MNIIVLRYPILIEDKFFYFELMEKYKIWIIELIDCEKECECIFVLDSLRKIIRSTMEQLVRSEGHNKFIDCPVGLLIQQANIM